MSAPLFSIRNVTKAFGAFKAVDDASVSVEEGDVLGLIGPNGAGKSTFFNCLTGDLAVTSGTVSFAGADVTRHPPEVRAYPAVSILESHPMDSPLAAALWHSSRASHSQTAQACRSPNETSAHRVTGS